MKYFAGQTSGEQVIFLWGQANRGANDCRASNIAEGTSNIFREQTSVHVFAPVQLFNFVILNKIHRSLFHFRHDNK